jgi:hypothetical protein
MADYGGQSEREEFRGARIQVLGTNTESPEEGRIFVWTKMGWFERLEGPSGNVAFTHVANSEEELREYISRDNPGADLSEISGAYKEEVYLDFMQQSRSYSGAPENLSREPGEDNQEYHQHDL